MIGEKIGGIAGKIGDWPLVLTIEGGAGTVLTLDGNGAIKVGPGLSNEDAARGFLDALSKCVPCFLADLRSRAEVAEARLAGWRDQFLAEASAKGWP